MTKRMMILAILLMVALPSIVCARWIKDKVYLQTDSVGKVEFSHYTHMEMESIGKNCPTCHNDVFHIVTKKNPVFTMADMEEGKACGFCHNGKMAFSVKGDCTTCHTAGDIAIQTENVGKVTFSHDVHVGELGSCDDCHPDLFKAEANSNHTTMKEMENGVSCGACHDGSTAFTINDCTTCHAGDVVYKEPDAGDVTFPHAAHIEMFGCDECHPDLFKAEKGANKATMEDMEKGESCGACHDGSTAFGVAEDCESCHKT